MSIHCSKNKYAVYHWAVITLSFLAIWIVVPVLPAHASGSFNIFPIDYNGAQNTDLPLLDVRNVTSGGSFSASQSAHNAGISANPGDTLEFLIYYHNGLADATENIAHNVRISANLPSGSNSMFNVSASISSSDSPTVNSSDGNRGGNVNININGSSSQSLQFLSGSTQWFPNRSSSSQSLPDGITSGGVLIGDIRGCWNFSGFVKFRAVVSNNQPSTGSLQITKTVGNITQGVDFQDSVNANPSDSVKFRISVYAYGNTVTNVIIRDILPSSLIYTSNTTQVNGVTVSDSNGLFGSGYNFGTMTAGQTVNVTFQAQLASSSFFGSTSQTVTNTANVRGDNVSTQQDTANINVAGQVAASSFSLSKSAFNQTQGVDAQTVMANSGDVINYTLTYNNTGGVQNNNVIVQDDLSNVLNLADIVNYGGGTLNGNVLQFPAISVPAGISISKTFQVKVREVPSNQSGLSMVNVYGNQITVPVRSPRVAGAYIPPKAGPGENLAFVFSFLFTAGIYLRKKYPELKLKFFRS